MQRYLKLLVALMLMLSLAACGGDDAQNEDDAGITIRVDIDGDNPFIERADADTAYLYANLQRMPEAIVDAVWAMNDASSASNEQMMQSLEHEGDVPPEVRALMSELMKLVTREGWEGAGLPANPIYAVHAVSVFPFAHLELNDARAFSALIDRVEANLGQPLQRRDVNGETVIWFEIDPAFGIALHHDDTSVSAAVIPDQPDLLARLTGQTSPDDAMDADQLEDFNNDLGLTGHGSGYINWQRIINELQRPGPALLALDQEGILAMLGENQACVNEFNALTTAMPRMVYGYTELSEERMDFLARQETSAELGRALAPIAQAPVAIDQSLNGLFNFGMAFDLIAAREFAQGLVDGWVENPPQCPMFEGIASGAADMQTNLNRPIPPMITNLQGMYFEAMSFDVVEGMQPQFTGTLSFFMNNPQLLVGMAQMFSPAVATLELEPGAAPQPVPTEALPPQIQALELDGWIGMGENAIGMAIGEEHIGALEQRLETTDADPYLMAGKMDFDILVSMMDIAGQTLQDDEELQMMLDVQRQQYEAIAEFYDTGEFTIGLSEQGIDMFFGTDLK